MESQLMFLNCPALPERRGPGAPELARHRARLAHRAGQGNQINPICPRGGLPNSTPKATHSGGSGASGSEQFRSQSVTRGQ